MSSTYTWSDALNVVKPYIKSIPTSTIDSVVCDQVNALIWKSFPWRWAQFSFTSASGALALVNGQQDYGVGTLSAGGYYAILRARITRTDTTPWIAREKDITNWLAPNLDQSGSIDSIQAIAYEPVSSGLRLDRAASVSGSATYQIDGEYWAQPLKVTSTATVIVFPDQYFDVAIEGIKWKYYQLGDDSRAADQRNVFIAMLEAMKQQEDYADAPGTRFPGDAVGASMAGNPGLFGWY